MNKKDRTWYQLEARRILKNHDYVRIGFGKCEVWQCTNNGSSTYGFDISISRFGIAVHGDIGSLSFRVGSYYGMSFLAGKDVEYYIYSKLDEAYHKTQVVKEKIKDMLAREMFYLLEDIVCDPSEIGRELPEEQIGYKVQISEDSEHIDEMYEFAEKVSSGEISGIEVRKAKMIFELLDAYRIFDDKYFEVSPAKAYEIMYENTSIDLADGLSVTEPDRHIMWKLYIVNHAAKQIMKIKTGSHPDFRYMWE
jgi:hypothetical protein